VVPENSKVVGVDSTAGTLTIAADGTKVYEAKLRKGLSVMATPALRDGAAKAPSPGGVR
jgi:hypothetical protein